MHFVFNSKVVYKSEAYLSVRIRWKKSTVSTVAQRHHWFTKKKCHELMWSGGNGQKGSSPKSVRSVEKMLSTTKTYPCAKKNVVLACKRKRACTAINLKDAVIPLRMYWAHNPTGGDTQWSTLVLHKLCLSSLICLEIPIFASWQQTYTCVR